MDNVEWLGIIANTAGLHAGWGNQCASCADELAALRALVDEKLLQIHGPNCYCDCSANESWFSRAKEIRRG